MMYVLPFSTDADAVDWKWPSTPGMASRGLAVSHG